MEDELIVNLDLPNGLKLFAVLDGHSGPEVSKWVSLNYVKHLIELDSFKRQDYKAALQEVNFHLDNLMKNASAKREMYELTCGT